MKGGTIRRPKKVKHSKGMKQFLKQTRRSIEKTMRKVAGAIPNKNPGFNSQAYKRAFRSFWISGQSRSKYMPHQGVQECARRVRQMAG